MKARIIIAIECGEKTCASEPGKFCTYLVGNYRCALFGRLYDNEDGWVARHPECMRWAAMGGGGRQ